MDRVGSRAIAKSWECLGQGSPVFFCCPPPLYFFPLRGVGRAREESGATVVNSAAKREDFSASSNL